MLLVANNLNRFSGKLFCFENYWLEYAECISIVRNALNFQLHSSPMHNFAHILARIIKSLLDWICYGVCAMDKAIKDTELQLQALELDDMENSSSEFYPANLRSL